MKTYYVAGGAIFGALAVTIRLLQIKFPFPLVPYLQFEFAEVPILVGFLLYGPLVGVIAALSYWGGLNLLGEFVPIGPAMAFAASLSTVAGVWAGLRLFRRLTRNRTAVLSMGLLTGTVLRVVVMTAFNYVIIWILFPFFFDFASSAVSSALGISFESQLEALALILGLTALFNVLQMLVIALPSLAIVKAVENRVAMGKVITPWIVQVLKS